MSGHQVNVTVTMEAVVGVFVLDLHPLALGMRRIGMTQTTGKIVIQFSQFL